MNLQEIEALSVKHPILLFDGYCNLCNAYVQWLLKHDKNALFRYASLLSESGTLIQKQLIRNEKYDTVILVSDGRYYSESDVALIIMQKLGGIYLIFYPLIFIPKGIRNWVYSWISKNRYRWFGKKDQCMVPEKSVVHLFIDI